MASIVLSGDTSGTVTLAAPTVAGTQSYTLPTAVPAANGYALTSTTGGVMSWATPTKLVSSGLVSYFSSTSATYVDITGFTVSITPTSTSSKILVFGAINGICTATTTSDNVYLQLTDSANTQLALIIASTVGNLTNNQFVNSPFVFLHSPASTSAQTYKIRGHGNSTNGFQIGNAVSGLGLCTINAMEIFV